MYGASGGRSEGGIYVGREGTREAGRREKEKKGGREGGREGDIEI